MCRKYTNARLRRELDCKKTAAQSADDAPWRASTWFQRKEVARSRQGVAEHQPVMGPCVPNPSGPQRLSCCSLEHPAPAGPQPLPPILGIQLSGDCWQHPLRFVCREEGSPDSWSPIMDPTLPPMASFSSSEVTLQSLAISIQVRSRTSPTLKTSVGFRPCFENVLGNVCK